MPQNQSVSKLLLLDKHGLSPFQVNLLFGEEIQEDSLEMKAGYIGKVAEFIKITDLLISRGLKFIPLKGPVLSYRIYGDATVRRYCDLDLLMDLPAVLTARDLLKEIGYEPNGYQLPVNRTGHKIVFNHVHHILLRNSLSGLTVELHWRLFQTPPVPFRRLQGLVEENLTELQFAGRSLDVLSQEFELLYLIMHGSIHYWQRLKWLTDIHEYLKKYQIDWGRFKVIAEDLRAGRLVSLTNHVLSEYFPSGPLIPWKDEHIPFLKSFTVRKINQAGYSDRESMAEKIDRLRFSFHCYPGPRYKLRRIRTAVFFYLFQAFSRNRHLVVCG